MEKRIEPTPAELEILGEMIKQIELARAHKIKAEALKDILMEKWGIKAELAQFLKMAKQVLETENTDGGKAQSEKAGHS